VGGGYSIKAAAEESGLSVHTIRAWERRYGVLSPTRTGTNRRVYTTEDVGRLTLLRRAVEAGHAIGLIGGLDDAALAALVRPRVRATTAPSAPETVLRTCLAAVHDLDPVALQEAVDRASAIHGVDTVLAEVLVPLLRDVERGWLDGTGGIAHEHLASAVMRAQLDRVLRSLHAPVGAPRIVVTTPSGQLHEIGALFAAVTAAREGWAPVYLGPNLPAADIAVAVRKTGARAVALSIVLPNTAADLASEFKALRDAVGSEVAILVGGRAVAEVREELEAVGATVCADLETMRRALVAAAG